MKLQDLIIIIVFFFFIISGGSKPNVIPPFNHNLLAYEAEVAYRVLDTDFNDANNPIVPDIIPNPANCPCKGTKKVKSPDGIANIPCPCGDNCPCKKPQGFLPDETVIIEEKPKVFTYMFGATWCPTCVTFKRDDVPKLEHKSGWNIGYEQYQKGNNLVVVDVNKSPQLFSQYAKSSSQTIPFYVVTRDGKEIGSKSKYMNHIEFAKWSNELVNPTKQVTKQPSKQVTNCPTCPTKTTTVYKRQILFGEPWVENGRNTTVQHLINEHGYTRAELAPYANNPNALNRIHGYAHTHRVR